METQVYMECNRNHAAHLGAYSLDGCREFLSQNEDEYSCAACGCHRNYHRRIPLIDLETEPVPVTVEDGEGSGGRGRGRRLGRQRFNFSLRVIKNIARLRGEMVRSERPQPPAPVPADPLGFRARPKKARFTVAQREALLSLAQRLGWKMRHRGHKAEVDRAISEIGVCRRVFKTWLYNNKRFYHVREAASSSHTP
ncbi:zinc-finger homeodomain protein 14-like [Carica papaya]|uniref:zinc-finger homeodomain protein 14-like n=1 Tax=Carica papaya TaxID=3649 RepID=UPI000B8CDFCB|nr:zinc-finger homeodomain protein 14-like [Carica papaya]